MDDIRHGDQHDSSSNEPDNDAQADGMRRCTLWNTLEGRVLSLVSRKGGVGKTTSAVNLGAALALSGHTVLIIGTDPQCGICRTLGTSNEDLTTSLDEVFSRHESLTNLAQPSPLENLFFVSPRITSLDEEEAFLGHLAERVDDFVREVDRARNLYDTILIDCPPSLGPAAKAALLASDSFLVPVQAEELCRASLDPLLEFIETLRDRNSQPDSGSGDADRHPLLEGLFLTMASQRTRMGKHVAAMVCEDFGDSVFEASIPRTTRLSEMALKGKPAVIYDRRSPGSRAYFDLADELVRRYCGTEAEGAEAVTLPIDAAMVRTPTRPEPEAFQAKESEPGGIDDSMVGLGRFLADLGGGSGGGNSKPEEPALPEMVSLDELLAEEEQQTDAAERDRDGWAYDLDSGDSMN